MLAHRALLVTDVADSTALAERLGAAGAGELWARHDAVARELLALHGGREIDKADGFLLLFERAPDAVAYAAAYHAALGSLGLKARAGIHVGEVALREAPAAQIALGAKPLEVDGPAKHVASRIMSVALPGQTLASREAAGSAPSSSHGFWRMKGLGEPMELFEVGASPGTPPTDHEKVYRVVRHGEVWLPAREIPRRLPRDHARLLGREADLAALAARVEAGAALVTITGTGGTGKTRLVTRYAWAWLGEWPGGAWFCDLSDARDADGIATAVARGLDIAVAGADPVRQIGEVLLGRGRCLVVLDNFEQVAGFARETLGRWLDRTQEAVFVVTSRQVLGLPGEEMLPLEPLAQGPGVELFLACAEASRGAPLPAADRPVVEQLVQLLDGLPLAIELAAARSRGMPPATVLARMADRFRLLASPGGRPDRHATLKAALDGSWDLLSADERSALAQLSVFSGGFTLEAADAVLDVGGAWPGGLVQALVDRSLVRPVGEGRFDLLVSVHAYAEARLAEVGGADAVALRHLEWAAAVTRHADALAPMERIAALGVEIANLEAAVRRGIARADHRAAGPLAGACAVWTGRGPASRGAELAEALLAAPGAPPAVRGQLLHLRGEALHTVGRIPEAAAVLEESVRVSREAGDALREARALHSLAGALLDLGRTEAAEARILETITLARAHAERRLECLALARLGTLERRQGRLTEAREHVEAAIAGFREQEYRRGEIGAMVTLGAIAWSAGDLARACAVWDEGLALAEAEGDLRHQGLLLSNLGGAQSERGHQDLAAGYLERSLALAITMGSRTGEAQALANLASIEERGLRFGAALVRRRRVLAIYERAGDVREIGICLTHMGVTMLAMGDPEAAREALERAVGLMRQVGDRSGQGGALAHLGLALARLGRHDQAEAHGAEGEALLEAAGASGLRHAARVIRAEISWLAGDRAAAEAHLAAAAALGVSAAPDSAVSRRSESLRASMATA